MNDEQLYKPYSELPDVSTGSTVGLFYVKDGTGGILPLQFEEGRLNDASTLLKQKASEEVQHTIELLEKKLMDEEAKGIEDEAPAQIDDTKDPFDPSTISIEKRVVTMDSVIRRLEQKTIKLNPGF